MTIHPPPPATIFLRRDSAGMPQGLKFSTMWPFLGNSSVWHLNLLCIVIFILQWGKLSNVNLRIRTMACLKSLKGRSSSGNSSGTISQNFLRIWYTSGGNSTRALGDSLVAIITYTISSSWLSLRNYCLFNMWSGFLLARVETIPEKEICMVLASVNTIFFLL